MLSFPATADRTCPVRQQTLVLWCPITGMRNFLIALAAVLLGNAIYFAAMPYLPPAARHGEAATLDLGLLIDFGICLVLFGVFHRFARRRDAPVREARRDDG